MSEGRKLGQADGPEEQPGLEAIVRARTLLALSGLRLDRQEAGAARAQAHQKRQHAVASRESVAAERDLAAWLPDPSQLIERAEARRKRAVTAAEAFAALQGCSTQALSPIYRERA